MQTAYVQFPVREKEQSFSYKFAATRVGLFQTTKQILPHIGTEISLFFFELHRISTAHRPPWQPFDIRSPSRHQEGPRVSMATLSYRHLK